MPSLTVENYLKAALIIGQREGIEWISTGQLADQLDVSPGSATSMMKSLSEAGLTEYRPYGGVKLTAAGRKLAVQMQRRHRLLEAFLVETLGLSWDQVHEEAENMEHAVSDFLIDQIDEFLGRPDYDPHGDPIPTPDGQLRGGTEAAVSLCDCAAGERVRFVRVLKQDAEFLKYLAASGHQIGEIGTVEENNVASGIVTTSVGGKRLTLSIPAAEAVLVEIAE